MGPLMARAGQSATGTTFTAGCFHSEGKAMEMIMPKTNLFTVLLASASLVMAGTFALAGPAGQGKGQGKGQERAAKHMHKNTSGKNALGEKLKRNGKHAVGRIKDKTVTADVDNGKVRNM